jgi:sugar phosphate isomerase/epimerase
VTRIPKIIAGLMACVLLACGTAAAAEKVCLVGKDFSAWGKSADWSIAGDAFLHPNNENLLSVTPGTGVIINGRRGNSPPLVSRMQFGDVRAHIEFAVPKKTNAGVYFQGRYKLNICDIRCEPNGLSPGLECGGIYPRWDNMRAIKAYDGQSPRVNACRPRGQWQSFDVVFRAPRFDKQGRKIANACFVKVIQNGIVIHENAEVAGPTRDSPQSDESAKGPIALQGDHGPVAFRNIWIVPIELDKMGLTNPFFAMDTGTIDEAHKTAKSQAEMLKELGYSGIGYWERNLSQGTKELEEMLSEMDSCGLKAYSVYFTIRLEEPKERYLPLIKDSIKLLKGRGTIVWLAITSEDYRKSSPAGDERAASLISEIADIAHKNDIKIALYPHSDFWLEKIEDAVRLAQKVNRRNVGVTFNLYHWLKTDKLVNMESAIEKAMPYLFMVTINGTTEAGSIETLDKGTFDVYGFLKALKRNGFEGPIGLQGYGIGGDVRENLRRSMEAWREFSLRLATEQAEMIN